MKILCIWVTLHGAMAKEKTGIWAFEDGLGSSAPFRY